MAERAITKVDVEMALRQTIGHPSPGLMSSMVIEGYASGRRILKVCVQTSDPEFVITAYWR